MTDAPPASRAQPPPLDLLSGEEFQAALRGVVHFRQHVPVADPIASAVRRIELNPFFAQSRLLTRLLESLGYQRGAFRRAEIATLDAEGLAIAISLMDAHRAGTFSPAQWTAGADSAQSAESRG